MPRGCEAPVALTARRRAERGRHLSPRGPATAWGSEERPPQEWDGTAATALLSRPPRSGKGGETPARMRSRPGRGASGVLPEEPVVRGGLSAQARNGSEGGRDRGV